MKKFDLQNGQRAVSKVIFEQPERILEEIRGDKKNISEQENLLLMFLGTLLPKKKKNF